MKTISWIFFALIFSSGCSGFYKMHYRKLNKIPASNDYSNGSILNNCVSFVSRPELEKLKVNQVIEDTIVIVNSHTAEQVNSQKKLVKTSFHPIKKSDVIKKSTKTISTKFHSFQSRKDSKFLIILGLLALGFLLIGYGLFFIYIAFFAPNIIAGILVGAGGLSVLLLGILPFAGVLSMLRGKSKKGEQKPFEEKKN